MKFQCDRCKTRYSIADERVRGKVLKIRCKNCAGVITVRESGASSEGGASAPAAASSAPARARAAAPLGAAFDRAMAEPAGEDGEERTSLAPPPSGEDEWYLSTGSDQDGPFDVKEARRRIASAKSKDDLFGWKEGFADWLPVGQIPELSPPVAKKPPAPPPLPPPRTSAPPIPAAASPAQSGRAAALSPSARPAVPAPAAQASAASASTTAATAAAKKPAIGLAALAAEAAAPAPLPSARAVPAPAPTSEGTNPSLSLAELAKNTVSNGGPASNGNGNGAKAPIAAASAPPAAGGDEGDDDGGLDFKISEASQLIDMSKLREVLDKPASPLAAAAAARRTTAMAAVGRGTGPAAAIGGDAAVAPAPAPAKRPRAALLIGGGVLIMAGVVGGLVYLTTDGDSGGGEEAGRGANANVLGDYYREGGPNVITRNVGPVVPSGPVGKIPTRPATGTRPTTGVTNAGGSESGGKIDTLAGGQELVELTPQDVLDKMAQARPAVKQCFNYALKTDPTLRISRLDVRLSVAPDGNVNEVKYLSGSEKSQTLNQCLMTLLKRWHFKPSREGLTTDLPILFSSG